MKIDAAEFGRAAQERAGSLYGNGNFCNTAKKLQDGGRARWQLNFHMFAKTAPEPEAMSRCGGALVQMVCGTEYAGLIYWGGWSIRAARLDAHEAHDAHDPAELQSS